MKICILPAGAVQQAFGKVRLLKFDSLNLPLAKVASRQITAGQVRILQRNVLKVAALAMAGGKQSPSIGFDAFGNGKGTFGYLCERD